MSCLKHSYFVHGLLLMHKSNCSESTAERARIDGSSLFRWSFLAILAMTMTMIINLNSVLLVHVASVGWYESFEDVQNCCVPSTNNFHSCLCALKTYRYHLCRTACMLYSSHSYCIPGCSNCILHHSYMTVRLGHDQKTVWNKTNGAWMCQRLLQSRYSC